MLDFRAVSLFKRFALSLILVLALQPMRASAQEQGTAVITSPLDGATVSGLVLLTGTATHPQFVRYELAFSYSPNPTDTWFTLQDPALTQVVNDVLGRWDTTNLSDGLYVLRLRVYWSDRNFLEAFARNVLIQNAAPTPTPFPTAVEATPAPLLALTLPPPAGTPATQALIVLPPPSTPRPTTNAVIAIGGGNTLAGSRLNMSAIGAAFLDGVRLTLIIFALLGLYAILRAALRAWLK